MDADGGLRVRGTRVTLDSVIGAFSDGATPEEIGQQYPTLDLADIYAVLSYYLRHRAEVEVYLQRRQQQAQAVRQQNAGRTNPHEIRERLLARRAQSKQ